MPINKLKAIQMVRFKSEFYKDFSKYIKIEQSTKKYHYFEIYDGVISKTKIVNKQSLREIYQYDCEDLFNFFRSNNELLPQLLYETTHFFIFEYVEGELVKNITIEDFNYLQKFEDLEFYPFVNSLYTNLVRKPDNTIKLIDLKHLDFKICNIPEYIKKDLIIFLYNKEDKVSKLFIKSTKYLDEKIRILERDYHNIEVIKFEE